MSDDETQMFSRNAYDDDEEDANMYSTTNEKQKDNKTN